MRLIVNGREKEFRDGLTVDALITEEGEPVGHVLVEVNGEYVPTRLQKGRVLAEGDRVETILPAFGG
ncbi:MAG: thiamine biosynthesis protein ThiS [Planctomycetes bacterium RBG_16_59_8]|nr:MAG: thiamine biosynthesis protein ThiS [Planctomycetes bacterium RBG_16_59_8]